MRREDAEDPVVFFPKDPALDETLPETGPCPLPESHHDTLGLLAFLLHDEGQGLVQQSVAGGVGVPDHQATLAHTLIGARDVDAVRQRELDEQSAAERSVNLGAGCCELAGLVISQEEQEILCEEHDVHPMTSRGEMTLLRAGASCQGLATVEGVSWQQAPAPERRRSTAGIALRVILLFVASLYLVEVLDQLFGSRLQRVGGVEPREVDGMDGILFAPILHGSWEHLLANTVPLLVFGFLLLLAGVRRWLEVTAVVWLVGGAGVWLVGGAGTVHVGASVLVFGWLCYLLLRGVFSGHPGQLALGVLLLLVYGGVLWGVLPGQPGISWQGHLFGAIGGGLAAWWLGRADRSGRQSHGWP